MINVVIFTPTHLKNKIWGSALFSLVRHISLIAFCIWYSALIALMWEHFRSQIIIISPGCCRPNIKAMAKLKSKPIHHSVAENHFAYISLFLPDLQLINSLNFSNHSILCQTHCTSCSFHDYISPEGTSGKPQRHSLKPIAAATEEGCFALCCFALTGDVTGEGGTQ